MVSRVLVAFAQGGRPQSVSDRLCNLFLHQASDERAFPLAVAASVGFLAIYGNQVL